MCNFLDDFYNPAREDVNAEVVFLNKKEPDLEFDGLLKREKTKVKYFTVRETIFPKYLTLIFPAGDSSEQPRPPEGSGGEGGSRVGAGGQVQHGAGEGGPLQHHESHLHEELQRVHQGDHPAPVLLL